MQRIGRLGAVLLSLTLALTACAGAPETVADVKDRAEQRRFSVSGEPQKSENGTWKVAVTFGGIACPGTLFFDAAGGVVLESKGTRLEDPNAQVIRVEDPDAEELLDDKRFENCYTRN